MWLHPIATLGLAITAAVLLVGARADVVDWLSRLLALAVVGALVIRIIVLRDRASEREREQDARMPAYFSTDLNRAIPAGHAAYANAIDEDDFDEEYEDGADADYELETNELRMTMPYDGENERRRALGVAAGVTVRTYPDRVAFERDAARLAGNYWVVSSVVERKPNAGCLRILFLWWLVLIFPPRPELLVTYRYEPPAAPRPDALSAAVQVRSARISPSASARRVAKPGASGEIAAPAEAPAAAGAGGTGSGSDAGLNPNPNLEPVTHRACFSCGAIISMTHKFCPNCGAALGVRAASAPANPAADAAAAGAAPIIDGSPTPPVGPAGESSLGVSGSDPVHRDERPQDFSSLDDSDR
jgi:hypothetical protein